MLLLFSGPYNRPDGIAALLQRWGVNVSSQSITAPTLWRLRTHDLLNDSFFTELFRKAKDGHFLAIFAAPPCITYSVARYFQPKGTKTGAPPVRSRTHIPEHSHGRYLWGRVRVTFSPSLSLSLQQYEFGRSWAWLLLVTVRANLGDALLLLV